MGSYLGIYTILVLCLLGYSANAEVFNAGGPPNSDITAVSTFTSFYYLHPNQYVNQFFYFLANILAGAVVAGSS